MLVWSTSGSRGSDRVHYNAAAPTAERERLVISRLLWHGGHAVLRWNASNVAVRQDPPHKIKPNKERSRDMQVDL
jgi:hypothetical protein